MVQLVRRGVVSIDDNLQLHVDDIERYKSAVTQLYAEHLEMCHTGNKEMADAYVAQNSVISGSKLDMQIKSIVAKIDGLGIPRDITVKYDWNGMKA